MSRQANDQIPLGELLFKARSAKRRSRAQLAKEAGITESSLVRYEKAGIEEGGQYPPSPKLACLCFLLNISPLEAMLSCLDYDDYWDFKGETWENDLLNHPDFRLLCADYVEAIQENRRYRALLRLLLNRPSVEGEFASLPDEEIEHLKANLNKVLDAEDDFLREFDDLKTYEPTEGVIQFPGIPLDRRKSMRWGKPHRARRTREREEIGLSPSKDPGRFDDSQDNPEAAPTASKKPSRRRPDK